MRKGEAAGHVSWRLFIKILSERHRNVKSYDNKVRKNQGNKMKEVPI